MKNTFKYISAVFILALAFNIPASASTWPTISKFNSDQYIFIGEVVNLINEDRNVRIKTYKTGPNNEQIDEIMTTKINMVGLRIKVDDPVHLPKPSRYYNVYVFDYPLSKREGNILMLYQVGSKVRFIGREFTELINGGDDTVSLRISLGNLCFNEINGETLTTSSKIYDYKEYIDPFDGKGIGRDCSTCCADEKKVHEETVLNSKLSLPRFELQKDLFRLEMAKSEAEKLKIFERLKSYPGEWVIDFEKLERNYFPNWEIEEKNNPELYKRLALEINDMLARFRESILSDDFKGALEFELASQKEIDESDLNNYKKYFLAENFYKATEFKYLSKTKADVAFIIAENKEQSKDWKKMWWRMRTHGVGGFDLKLVKTPSGWRIYHHYIK